MMSVDSSSWVYQVMGSLMFDQKAFSAVARSMMRSLAWTDS